MSEKPFLVRSLSVFALLLITGCANSLPPELTWEKVLYAIREKFPDVASVSTEKLERWITVGGITHPCFWMCERSMNMK
ncbi:hypothetical protein [Methylacidiphilum kamchatkense]|uniref:Lipoprotein n=1 Tax=Methylacidiphilum kamchatkense Kam1 TaxID=1202785 RepID=A0A516TKG8_9BACT|nr:hypothetical protein [Methylacidiphilum kamchatkense]QDQ41733.1 hypothetical protein kam1_482 [Methylacidiphilum kamchatkense Kam1]